MPSQVRAVLGDDARLCHAGVMLSLPDSATQPWHSDGPHAHGSLQARALRRVVSR
jgi:hypothetical protein